MRTLLPLEDLFSIDVEAEIRKLCSLRFKTQGESIVEIVRFAADQDPSRIDVRMSHRRYAVSVLGARLPEGIVERLAGIFDTRQSPEARHLLLVSLEESFGLGILAAFADGARRVRIEWMTERQACGIELGLGRLPRRTSPPRLSGFKLSVRRSLFRNLALERALVQSRCQYATIPITLNGQRISHGMHLGGCLVQSEISSPGLSGVVGVPREGEVSLISLAHHGIVVEEKVKTARRGLIVKAIIELQEGNFEQAHDNLRRLGHGLYVELASLYEQLGEASRERTLDLLCQRYQHTRKPELLSGVRAFRRAGGRSFELEELREAARRETLYAVDADAPLDVYDIAGRQVLRLDRKQRAFLAAEPGIELASLPPRAGRQPFKLRPSERARELLRRVGRVFFSFPGEPLSDDVLDAAELAFLAAVREELRSGRFALEGEARPLQQDINMASGQRLALVRRVSGNLPPRYLIARGHPLVRRMIAGYAADEALLYPALVALADGHDGCARNRERARRAAIEGNGKMARGAQNGGG